MKVRTPSQPLRFIGLCGVAALLLTSGCQSPQVGKGESPKPNLSPQVTDVRTEANMIALENEYIAGKNSPPPRPEQAAAMKRMQEKEQAAKAAKAEKDRQ